MRIMFSARDAAAALYVAPLAELANRNRQFSVIILAQEPAFGILSRLGIPATFIDAPVVNSAAEPDAKALLSIATSLVARYRPETIIVGLSSPGQGGLDEALLQVAQCPTFLLQDFWGEFNPIFQTYPDVFLVLDSAAAELTRQRYGAESFIIGSPRHAGYKDLDFQSIRRISREKLEVGANKIIGWFGQSLHHVPGYEEVIEQWIDAVESLNDTPTIVYKPHPRESESQRQRTMALLSRSSASKVFFLEEWPIENALLSCDCVCSIMSNCLYDAAYLNFHSGVPLISPVSVLSTEPLLSNLSTNIAFEALPYTRLSLAETILPKDRLDERLEFALSGECIQKAWLNARENLVSPTTAAADTLVFIHDVVTRKALSLY